EALAPGHAERDRLRVQGDRHDRHDQHEDRGRDEPGDQPDGPHPAERERQPLVLLRRAEWRPDVARKTDGTRRTHHTTPADRRDRTSSSRTSSRAGTMPADVVRRSPPNSCRAQNGTRTGFASPSVEPTCTQHCWRRSTFRVQASMKDLTEKRLTRSAISSTAACRSNIHRPRLLTNPVTPRSHASQIRRRWST